MENEENICWNNGKSFWEASAKTLSNVIGAELVGEEKVKINVNTIISVKVKDSRRYLGLCIIKIFSVCNFRRGYSIS